MRSRKVKIWVAVLTALALFLAMGIGVYAYLHANSGNVTNNMTPATPQEPTISNEYMVSVGETGYTVYVRAIVVATWRNEEGHVLAQAPREGVDYTITWNAENWFENNGFRYHYDAVASGGNTKALISSVNKLQNCTVDGYELHVQIVSQTIQAIGTTDGANPVPAVQDAWGVYVDSEGKLTTTPPGP